MSYVRNSGFTHEASSWWCQSLISEFQGNEPKLDKRVLLCYNTSILGEV